MKTFFWNSSSVYSCHLFLISSAPVRNISVLYWAHIFMKCSLGISDFLEEIFSLPHSIVSHYFFALITEEGFLISPCYSLELCIQMGLSFLFSFAFCFPSFQRYFYGLLLQPFCLFAFLFLWDGLNPWLLSWTSLHSSSGTLSIKSNSLSLFFTSTA